MSTPSPTKENINKGAFLMALAGLCFAMMIAFARQAAMTLPISQVVSVRTGINLLVVLFIIYYFKLPLFGKNKKLLLLRGITGTVSIGLAFYAAANIPLVDTSILVKTSIVFTALIASFWLSEPLSRSTALNIILAFFGIALIIKPSWIINNMGGLAALLAAIFIGLTGALIRKLHNSENPYTIIFYFTSLATITYPAIFSSYFLWPDPLAWTWLILSGITGTAGQICFTLGYNHGSAAEVSPFLYSEVIFAALFGILFFGEIPDLFTAFGTALTVYAGVMIILQGKKRTSIDAVQSPSGVP